MNIYDGYKYNTIEEVQNDARKLGIELIFSMNTDVLKKPLEVCGRTIANPLVINPMEGCDSYPDGSPGELTKRRYGRFSGGMCGIIWVEATAVLHEGRANPRQLYINRKNAGEFAKLCDDIRENAARKHPDVTVPLLILQLTHSGRYSKPEGKPRPVKATKNPYLDKSMGQDDDPPVVSDDELMRIEEAFAAAAVLAEKAGYDGIDIKSCHGYLINELLGAHTREGIYGTSYENRTRFTKNVYKLIKASSGSDFIVTSRMNIYDALPFPYGFGVSDGSDLTPDYSESLKLIKELAGMGMGMVNITMGNPYYNPHINRPFDKGGYTHPEHPLVGMARLTDGAGVIQKENPDIAVVGSGYSYLRDLSVYFAAGSIEYGKARLAGFGREAFAYPDFAADIATNNKLSKNKCCIACGKCTEMMRYGGVTGCAVRDHRVYAKIYSDLKKEYERRSKE